MRIHLILSFITLGFAMSAQFNTIAPTSVFRTQVHMPDSVSRFKTDTTENSIEESVSGNRAPLKWCHPPLKCDFRISSGFGKRRNPFGKRMSEKHNGIDLAAKTGTPVYAMLPGEVIHIGYDSRSGNFIKLRHGNFTVSYCHLIRKPNIPIGSRVMPGQTVANVGSTGRSTGPHLHITLKRNGRVIDPTILLDYIDKYQ